MLQSVHPLDKDFHGNIDECDQENEQSTDEYDDYTDDKLMTRLAI